MRHVTSTPNTQTHHCFCCENDFTGNYCPTCGQKAGARHLTWSSVRSGIMEIWGVGSRSLPYTLLQLVLRPGYLIADYISGRRQVSFPPVKMLVIVALIVYLVLNWIDSPQPSSEVTNTDFAWFDQLIDWLSYHYDWAGIFFSSFLIIPTLVIFHYSPRCTRHTLPEGFFIQVFNSVQILIYVLLYNLSIGPFIHGDPDWLYVFQGIVLSLLLLRTYHQLFGYSLWGTLWRLVMVLVAAYMLLAFILVLSYSVYLIFDPKLNISISRFATQMLKYAAFILLPMLLSVHISKRSSRNRTQDSN